MPTALESREALQLITGEAVATGIELLNRTEGIAPEVRRAVMLDAVPDVVGYYSEGSAALAADFYDESRAAAEVATAYRAQTVVVDRTVKLRRAVAWASAPLFVEQFEEVTSRLAEVIQLDVARPYRDTMLLNTHQDAAAVGWRRVTRGGCKFCRMLADRGSVYRKETADFAAHTNCHCTAEPVFVGQPAGPEASVMQYMASRKTRTPKQRAELRSFLESFYPDAPG